MSYSKSIIVRGKLLALAALVPLTAFASNETIDSFSKAKRLLEQKVYQDHRITLYCGAVFDSKKNITPPKGFTTTKLVKRSKRIEWEHVVPAENFGRTFIEWREGDKQCVSSKGKAYKGRKCANKLNEDYKITFKSLAKFTMPLQSAKTFYIFNDNFHLLWKYIVRVIA